jgi:hypothetical protein
MASITTTDFAGITTTAAVNALDGTVVALDSLQETHAFLAGQYPGRRPGELAHASPGRTLSPLERTSEHRALLIEVEVSRYSDSQLQQMVEIIAQELASRRPQATNEGSN